VKGNCQQLFMIFKVHCSIYNHYFKLAYSAT
jgi:hypothetical protein